MTPEATVVVIKRRYAAAPEQVFDAFLDVATARRFLFATRGGEMIEATIEPRVGGGFVFTDRRPEMGDVRHVGAYLEIDRPRRLAFTFGVPQFDPRMTRVEIDIAPLATGGCELTLTHTGFAAEYAERNQEGWTRILAGLEPALAGETAAGWA